MISVGSGLMQDGNSTARIPRIVILYVAESWIKNPLENPIVVRNKNEVTYDDTKITTFFLQGYHINSETARKV